MRILLNILFIFISYDSIAQAPMGINYQAFLRNSAGDLLNDQLVSFKFNILQGTANSSPSYSETHQVTTNDVGQVFLVIGQGNTSLGSFNSIDWSKGNYFLNIEVELTSGSGFIDFGTTQFLSVPYALYAENVGGLDAIILSNDSINFIQNDRIAVNDSLIIYYEKEIDSLKLFKISLEQKVDSLVVESDSLTGSLASLKSQVDSIFTDIKSLSSLYDNQLSKVDSLDSILITLNSNYATDSALASLRDEMLLSNNQPFSLPRLSSDQRDSIVNPLPGMMIFNTDEDEYERYIKDYRADNFFEENLSSNEIIEGNNFALSFTAPATGHLLKFKLPIAVPPFYDNYYGYPRITINFYSGEGINENNKIWDLQIDIGDIGNQAYNFQELLDFSFWLDLGGYIPVTSGEKYTMSLSTECNEKNTNCIAWVISDSNTYEGGLFYVDNVPINKDATFQLEFQGEVYEVYNWIYW